MYMFTDNNPLQPNLMMMSLDLVVSAGMLDTVWCAAKIQTMPRLLHMTCARLV